MALSAPVQGMWQEWLVAQELLRRAAISGKDILQPFGFWQNKNHEIDFVAFDEDFIEVKRSVNSPIELAWFAHQFPGKQLTLVNPVKFATNSVIGMSVEEFLLLE